MSRFLTGVCVFTLAVVLSASAEQKWAAVNTAAASSDSSPSIGNAGRYTAYLCTVEAAEQMFGSSDVEAITGYLFNNYADGKTALRTSGLGTQLDASSYGVGQYSFIKYFPSVLSTSQYLSVLFYDNGDDSEFRVFGSDNAQRESTTWIVFDDEESGTVSEWTKPKSPIVATVTGASGTAGEGPFSCTLTVTVPASGSVALWYDENGEAFGATAPTYNTAGVYTNVVKVTATDYRDFIGTGVVTVAAAPLPPPIEAHYAAIITEEADGDTSPSLASAKDYSAYLCTKEAAEQMFGSSDVDAIAAYLAGNYEAGKAALGASGTLLDASEYSWGQYTFVKYFPTALAFSEYLGILFYDNADGSEFRIFGSDNATLIDDSVVFDDENTSGTVSDWTEPTPPTPPAGQGPTVAILGDSYSGFAGAVPTGFNPRYPQYTVNRVEKMWWHLFMENYGARLLHADSCNGWRGTYISMKNDADNLPSFIRASRLNALGDGLGGDGDPDIILVNGGTNDAWNNTDRGTELDCYDSATWTAANLVKFRPAVAYMLNYLKTRYVNAEIIVVINSTDDGSKGITDGYAGDLEEISAHYDVLSVRTHGVEKCESHPTAAGMRTIAQQVIAARNAAHEDMDGLTASVSGEVLSVTVAANAFVEPRDLYLVWDTADRGTALDGWANVEKIAANIGSSGGSVEVNLNERGIYSTKVFRVLASKSVSCDYLLATLESSGSQYIDLGYTMDITADSFEAELSFPSLAVGTNVKGVFGARDGYYSGDIALQVYKQADHFYNDRCNCNNTDSSTDRATVTPAVGATYTCFNSFDSRETYTAGVRTSSSTTNVGPAPGGKASGNAYVFALNAKSETSDRQPTTLTSLSVWTNSTVLAWDLVPCLADGKGALYNRVTGEILTNDGTDDFICGAIRQDAAAVTSAQPGQGEEPAALAISSADGVITVTVAAGAVTESTPVYLAWDETDKGETFAAWTNKAKIHDVDAEGGSFNVEGATLKIPNGAAIRAFLADGSIDLYATLTKPKTVSGMVDTLYQPGKQTKGFDLGVQFAGTWTGSGNNVLIMGVWDLTSAACEESGKAKEVLACNFSNATVLNSWPHVYQHTKWAKGSYGLTVNTTILSNPNTITLRTGQKPTWGTATANDPWPEAAPNYDFTVTMPVFGMRQVNANGTVTDYPLNGYDMTLSVFRIYEKPESAHVCVREYVPAEKDGVKGLYETMNGTFCPASATGFTLGGSPTNTIYTASTASTAATYSAGDTPEPPPTPSGVTAIGADETLTVDGDTVYVFSTVGTDGKSITVSGSATADILIVGGGGGGGSENGGGGGGGGVVYLQDQELDTGTYVITVGAGGAKNSKSSSNPGNDGESSSFSHAEMSLEWIAFGGGGGGSWNSKNGRAGGCGGGAGGGGTAVGSSTQNLYEGAGHGNAGGTGNAGNNTGGGGGGAGSAANKRDAGDGYLCTITGEEKYYGAGGGGGAGSGGTRGLGGKTGGGDGCAFGSTPADGSFYGAGGGGGDGSGSGDHGKGAAGYQGIVIVRVKDGDTLGIIIGIE